MMNSRTLIFSASAGSGKTFNLAVQYIALLIANSPREFVNTLAVTFTNKATAEMKDRILEQLYGIGNGLKESDDYLSCLQAVLRNDYNRHLPDSKVRYLCREALSAILHDYSRFNVSTIDTFFQGVLRNMAHELGLNARLQVDISNSDVVEMAIENLIDRLQHTDKELLPWLRMYIRKQINEGKRWDVRGKLKRMASCLFKEEYLKRSIDDEGNKPFTMANIKDFEETLERKMKNVLVTCKEKAKEFEDILADTNIDYNDLNYGSTIETYVKNIADGNVEDANFGVRLQSMVNEPRNMLKANKRKDGTLCKVAEKLSTVLDDMHSAQMEALPWVVSIDKIRESLIPMGVFDAIDKEIKRINNENNRFSLAHTPTLLREMIKEDDAPFVFEKIGTRYRNIMIDEFQDTSKLQWENFKVLLINNLSQGGMNMVVGDVKQSIYRWRNGDWHILHQLEVNNPDETITLDTNRRSKGNIVQFNNEFFKRAAACLDNIVPRGETPLKDLYRGAEQKVVPEKEGGGYVRIRIHKTEKGEDWEEDMLGDMHRHICMLRDKYEVPYNEMAILIRKRKYIDPLIKYFSDESRKVELVSDEAFYLRYSVANNLIINALDILNKQEGKGWQDRCSLPLRYLMKHCRWEDEKVGDVNLVDYSLAEPSPMLRKRFLDRTDELRRLPLYELCEELYRCLNIKKIEKQDAYVLCFFDELTTFLNDNPSDISSFLQYWEETMKEKTIPAGNVNGIRILTIHSAKGLQYHTVFIPYCCYSVESDKQEDFLWCMPEVKPLNSLGTLPISLSSKLKDSFFAREYIQEHSYKRTDELNVLYVAFTRAKHNLLVWGENKGAIEPDKTSETIGDLIAECVELEEEVYSLGQPSPYKKTEETKRTENRICPHKSSKPIEMHSYEGRIEFLQSKPAREFVNTWQGEDGDTDSNQSDYIEKGKVLHYIFSKIRNSGDIAKVLREMCEQGILESQRECDEVSMLVARGLENNTVKDWFSGKYRLFNECNLLRIQNGKLEEKRPDRVMVGDGEVIVVDFKFGKSKPEYNHQVEDYVNILQSMHPNKSIRGYLWYVYSNKIEQI